MNTLSSQSRQQERDKRILVILTGGTIGSKIGSDAINVNPAAAYNLINLYNQSYGEDTDFEVIQPLNVLSENMTPIRWNNLLNALREIDFTQYSGIVITHGSDTLSYSCALLGMLYGGAGLPIGVVAANYALEDARSNGLRNFRGAVSFIKNEGIPGVYAFYEDNKEVVQVYLATRLVEADCYADQFMAYGGEPLGYMKDDRFVRNEQPYNPTVEQITCNRGRLDINVEFQNDVLLIRSYPGLNYSFISLRENRKPKAVLIALYHSATSCVSEDGEGEYSLVQFAERCRNEGIAVYASSFKSTDMKFYASIQTFLDAGVVPMCNISTEAAYMKLMIAYNQSDMANIKKCETDDITDESVQKMLQENLFFEHLPEQ